MLDRKLQVFISSTYEDLKEERKAAVLGILDAGHIPAGMEFFAANDKSQWEIICKWIDESDVYLLILGGRYGTVEPISQKSYTQLEYEYAQSRHIPVFTIVLSDAFLEAKSRNLGYKSVMEQESHEKYREFRKLFNSKECAIVHDCRGIKEEVARSLRVFEKDSTLTGWIQNNKINFDTSKEIEQYLGKRIVEAKNYIFDLTWKDTYHDAIGRPNTNEYKQGQKDLTVTAIKALQNNVSIKEIFTFPNNKEERLAKMQILLPYDGYSCGFFDSDTAIKNFPKLHVTIIDGEEAFFISHDYNGDLCTIRDKNIIKILEVYFIECWDLCKKIKDYDGIHEDNLKETQSIYEIRENGHSQDVKLEKN